MNNPNLMAATMRGMPPPHVVAAAGGAGQSRFSNSRSSHEIGRGVGGGGGSGGGGVGGPSYQQQMMLNQQQRGLYLELEQRDRNCMEGSPPSDNVIFDNQCYATTPSSSNGNSDQDQPYGNRSGVRHPHHHQV